MTNYDYIKILDANNGVPTLAIIKKLLADNYVYDVAYKKLWDQYTGTVDIYSRSFVNSTKINNKLGNDFRGLIIRQTIGFLLGSPIAYNAGDDNANEAIQNFLIENDYDEIDSTQMEYTSVCGLSFRLLYVNKEGKEKMMVIKPWEAVLLKDAEGITRYAMIYYTNSTLDNTSYTTVEFYNDKEVYIYNISGENILNQEVYNHMFDYVPVIQFDNNNIEKGDFENVSALIDAYDRTVSDAQNELEEFRLAYMALKGVTITQETLQLARQSGAFEIPETGDINFITKNVNVEALKLQLDTLKENIYMFSDSINFNDQNESGATVSGVSRMIKTVSLLQKLRTKERKFQKGLREMIKILASALSKKSISIDYRDVTFSFNKNLPVPLSVQELMMLKGTISEETLLEKLNFIENIPAELEKIKQENESNYATITLSADEEE